MSKILGATARYFCTETCKKAKKPKRIRVKGASGYLGEYQEGHHKFMRNLSFFLAFPILAAVTVNCYVNEGPPPRPPFVKYEYLRIRHKRFAWGDGKHSFFHNPHTNALVDGYEDEH